MYKRIHGRLLFYSSTLVGLFMTGSLILGWHMTWPGPGRTEMWWMIITGFLPFIGGMGLVALWLRRTLGFPRWLGASLLAYPIITILTLSPEMRQFLIDSSMRARLAHTDFGQFTSLHGYLLLLTAACVLASLFFLHDLAPDGSTSYRSKHAASGNGDA